MVYLLGASVYAILAFRNFSSVDVVATLLLFSALPLGLIFFASLQSGDAIHAPHRNSILLAILVAPLIFFIQFSGISKWKSYFTNFANHRMGAEGGFHQDSVFHVAIIQGVLNTGRPTTGQHLEPWVSYHTLSHYIDAAALFLLRLDPWESYALLFFAKGVTISLAIIYFSMKVAQGRADSLFWITLLIVFPAFTATWHVIGSHGQWFPMLALALLSHRVFVIVAKERHSWREFLFLTLLVVIFSAGKVSTGFSFALIVGLWLFFRRPFDLRVVGVGAVWVGFLGLYSLVFSARVSTKLDPSGLLNLFHSSGREIFALISIAIIIVVVSRVAGSKYGVALSGAVIVSLPVTAGAVIAVTDNPSDVFYFFHGLFSTTLLLSVAFVASALFSSENQTAPGERAPVYLVKLLAFAGALLFAFSPVSSKAELSPYSDVGAIWGIASSVNGHTYHWFNQGAGPGERMSTWQAFRNDPLQVAGGNGRPWPSQFRDTLHEFTGAQTFSEESPVLFLTSEQFDFVADQMSAPLPWATGLAVTAVTGMPLVFGVLDSNIPSYGFSDYGKDAGALSEGSVTEELLCSLNRPVIVVDAIDDFNFSMRCFS